MKRSTLKTKDAIRQLGKTDEDIILRVSDGREISLGTPEEFRQVSREITDYTGGSSGGGAFSALWGLLCDHELNAPPFFRADHAEMIAQEAAWFQSRCGDGLSKQANALLLRLASLLQAEKNLSSPDIGQQELFSTSVALTKKLKLTEERLYTYNVSVSFNMQYTFTEKEVQPASESGEGDGPDETDPTEEALAALEQEIQECLAENYYVSEVEAFADCDSLLGVMIENLQEKRDSEHKPSKEELQAAKGRKIPDVIAPNLKVLFCGINPSLYGAAVGRHFANPRNRFWKTLKEVGFTESESVSPLELLKDGYGITDIVERATADAKEISESELIEGAQRLTTKVLQYKPKFVAVLGIEKYRKAFKRPKAEIGRQMESIGEATLWVLPNPSSQNGHFDRQKHSFQELYKAIGG